jgi:hypothetical protein
MICREGLPVGLRLLGLRRCEARPSRFCLGFAGGGRVCVADMQVLGSPMRVAQIPKGMTHARSRRLLQSGGASPMRSSRSIGTCQYWASDRPRGGPSRPSPQSRIGGVGMIARSIKGAAPGSLRGVLCRPHHCTVFVFCRPFDRMTVEPSSRSTHLGQHKSMRQSH